jgi:hypothetical protein
VTWWAQHGDTVGKAAALALTAGLTALAGLLSGRNTRALKAAEKSLPPPTVLPQAPPALPMRVSVSREVDMTAVRIQLSRALLELDERDSALRRIRATAEEDIRRQRATIDQLEAELRRAAAAITTARSREEHLHRELVELRRQIGR